MEKSSGQMRLLIQLYKAKKYEPAKELAAALTRKNPHDPVAWKILGALHKQTENTGKALFCFQKVIELSPYDPEAYFNLGSSYSDRGDADLARKNYEKALELKPKFAEAHNNLGNLNKYAGDLHSAIQFFKRAIEINPNLAQAHNNLGSAFREAGQLFAAKRSLEEATLKVPNFPEAHNNLGNTLRDLGDIEKAKICYEKALKLRPKYPEAVGNMGVLFKLLGEYNEAVAWNRRALSLMPSTEHYNNLGNSLAQIGEIDEAEECYREAIKLTPDSFISHSNLLFLISAYRFDIQTYQAQCAEYGRRVEEKVSTKYTTWECATEPKKFRIGLVSADLRSHPVGYFLESVLGKINTLSFEIIAYSNEIFEDEVTRRLKLAVYHWRSIHGLTDEKAAKLIYEDKIHILIDLSGHTVKNRLPIFGWKPAPVQVTWLGYFASTGVREIDYIIGDSDVAPIQEEEFYSEKIYHLPDSYLCFSPPPFEIEIGELPALKNGIITFGCVSNISRLTDNVIETWGEILKKLPSACLRIKDKRLTQSRERQRLLSRFSNVGISESRLIMEGDSSRIDYLEGFNEIDIVLAPFPYGGGTTTAEALWMGTPVMTFFGDSFLSRLGGSLMNTAGLEHWVACNEEEYIHRAISFASDLEKLSLLSEELREKVLASPLFDATLFARNLEAALLEIWESDVGR